MKARGFRKQEGFGAPDPGPGLMGEERDFNHAKLWGTALVSAVVGVGAAYLLFAGVEFQSWFPRDLRRFVHENEVPAFFALGVVLCVVFAVLFYLRGKFSQPAKRFSGWDEAIGEARPRPAFSAFAKTDGLTTLPVTLRRDKQACHGDLVLTDQRFYFLCYRDESVAQALGGQAMARQFGLLGVLVGAVLSGPGSQRQQQEIDGVRQEQAGQPLDQRAGKNPYSLSFAPHDITLLSKSAMGGTFFEAGGKKYPFLKISKGDLLAFKFWCERQGIPTQGL